MKKAGNALVDCIGGRAVHPVNTKLGGFYRAPPAAALQALVPELQWAREAALATLRFVATLDMPDIERDYEFVSLRHDHEYPMNEGRIVSSRGIDVPASEWSSQFEEFQVRHSNALHARVKARGAYLTGPLARYNLNFDRLPADVQAAACAAGLGTTCRNPFQSIIVRAVEVLFALGEALRLIAAYEEPSPSFLPVPLRGVVGHAATEAPRGLLYHRYDIGADGLIAQARIVPPTSQNQGAIEQDLWAVAEHGMTLAEDALRARCEHAIRNHDPCISCATHFLDLRVERA
jgi:coenzyme F420-reducing hydrogenase alpha subunit